MFGSVSARVNKSKSVKGGLRILRFSLSSSFSPSRLSPILILLRFLAWVGRFMELAIRYTLLRIMLCRSGV
ncbi:hypothetical protein Hdeb2414_s0002g00074041 [Helianthus debilis subsp. tardiflorus]